MKQNEGEILDIIQNE